MERDLVRALTILGGCLAPVVVLTGLQAFSQKAHPRMRYVWLAVVVVPPLIALVLLKTSRE